MRSRALYLSALLVGMFLSLATAQQPHGRRKALIIGNARYPGGESLAPTTENDARAIFSALETAGFQHEDIRVEFNQTHDQMLTDLGEFARKLEPEDKALFYFSGHGFSLDAENYLVPIGFSVGNTQTETKTAAVSVSSIINRMLAAKTQVVILDACRDEPDLIKALPKTMSDKAPAQNMVEQVSEGTLIAFAAASKRQADATPIEGKSIFTYYLVKNLGANYGDLQDAIDKTRGAVYEASNHKQNPAIYNDLQGDFPLGAVRSATIEANSLAPQAIVDALRRNISRETRNAKFIYSFHVWKIWLALPPELQSQVERVTYTYPVKYLTGKNTRWGDLNPSLGLTSWLANTCGTGSMQVDVQVKGHLDHITAPFDLCKVPESSDIPPVIH